MGSFVKRIQNEKGFLIIKFGVRLELVSIAFENFCEDNGISPLQRLLNKIVWLKRKIVLYKNLLDQC